MLFVTGCFSRDRQNYIGQHNELLFLESNVLSCRNIDRLDDIYSNSIRFFHVHLFLHIIKNKKLYYWYMIGLIVAKNITKLF